MPSKCFNHICPWNKVPWYFSNFEPEPVTKRHHLNQHRFQFALVLSSWWPWLCWKCGVCVCSGGGQRWPALARVRGQIYGLHQPEGGRSHAVCVTRYEVVAHAEQKLKDDAALAMRCINRGTYVWMWTCGDKPMQVVCLIQVASSSVIYHAVTAECAKNSATVSP